MSTPSHTGVLTEIFRTRYATARSIHPTDSVAACGADAQRLVARHHLDDTPVSANSPYGLMRDDPAYVLLLGVGLETSRPSICPRRWWPLKFICSRPSNRNFTNAATVTG